MCDQYQDRDGRGLVDIKLLSPDEWPLARDARLAALRDAPQSFLPQAPPEPEWTAGMWRHSCVVGQWAVARAGANIVGLARLTRPQLGPHLESVWTHPDHRRRRIASELVRRLIVRERARGARTVFVWVILPNPAAFELYESLGFKRMNERHLLEDLGVIEERLRLTGALRDE